MQLKSIFDAVRNHPKLEEKNILFLCVHGSRGYATATETSDYDVKGFYVADPVDFLGINPMSSESPSINGSAVAGNVGVDFEIHEVGKFFKMITRSNANMLEYIFAPEYEIWMAREDFETMRSLASECITKRIFDTYLGMYRKNMPGYYRSKINGKLDDDFDWNEDLTSNEQRKDVKAMLVMLRAMLSCYYALYNRSIEIDMVKTSKFANKEELFKHLFNVKKSISKMDFDFVFKEMQDLTRVTSNLHEFSSLPNDISWSVIKKVDDFIKEMRVYDLCNK